MSLWTNVSVIAIASTMAVPAVAAERGADQAQAPQSAQGAAQAPQAATQPAGEGLADITVTARRRSESLQSVPDSITAVTSTNIVNSGIKSIGDLAQITPNLNFRDGSAFSAGFYDLRMRGIGQAQQGWPGVAYIVDGVPADSPDALTSGSLADVERIEVLRGPQSALYGSGAIAGAINIITKRPTDVFHAEGRVYYGNGNDKQASAAISGALVPGKIYGRLSANYRDDDGRINSASNGLNLAPHHVKSIDGRLIFDPTERLEIDLRANYDWEQDGYAYQDRLPADSFITNYDPSFDARRAYAGRQTRKFAHVSGKISYDFGGASLTSITAYSHTRQYGLGDACYDDLNNPRYPLATGGVLCISNLVAYGNAATGAQNVDVFQRSVDNYDTVSQDVRLSSSADSSIQWLIGGSGMRRRALNGFGTFQQAANNGGNLVPFSNRADDKVDTWWGIYGQVGTKIGNFELTAAARYDNQKYTDTAYTDINKQTVILTTSPSGVLEATQVQRAQAFQPKGQLSYHVNQDVMAYVTVSKGFRAGYFNSGTFGAPEHTVNYEGGLKTAWFNHSLIFNVAGFHIDYSNQQTSTVINTPPYRVPITIPETKINGVELEATWRVTHAFTLNGSLAYLHAQVSNDTVSPKSPRWSGSIGAQYTQALAPDWTLNAHADMSFHSPEYMFINNAQLINSNQFVNTRIGVDHGKWGLYFVGRNLTNAKEAMMQAGHPAGATTRYQTDPRSYGFELRLNY